MVTIYISFVIHRRIIKPTACFVICLRTMLPFCTGYGIRQVIWRNWILIMKKCICNGREYAKNLSFGLSEMNQNSAVFLGTGMRKFDICYHGLIIKHLGSWILNVPNVFFAKWSYIPPWRLSGKFVHCWPNWHDLLMQLPRL